MAKLLTGVNNLSNTVTIPEDGEAVEQATFEPTIQQYLDNTFNLDARLTIAESDIDTNTTDIGTNTSDITALQNDKADDTIDMIAGAGLVGGGDLTANRTFDLANADGSLAITADDVKVGVLQTDAQHGDLGGGSTHADATGSVAGYMSAADKNKLDGSLGGVTTYLTTAVTGSQNNFNPTGWDNADGLLHANSTGITFTGFESPTATGKHKKTLILTNDASSMTLVDDSGSSDADNRVKVNLSSDRTFDAETGWQIEYDSTNTIWRVIADFGEIVS